MPFTVSHIVAVLPLVRGRGGRGWVPAALVIGSMVPDLPYFVPPHRGSDWTHAAYGPVTIDLVVGLALFALWRLVLRAPLIDLSPRGARGATRFQVVPIRQRSGGFGHSGGLAGGLGVAVATAAGGARRWRGSGGERG